MPPETHAPRSATIAYFITGFEYMIDVPTEFGQYRHLQIFIFEIDGFPRLVRLLIAKRIEECIRINRTPLTSLPIEQGRIRVRRGGVVRRDKQRRLPERPAL